MVSAARSTSSLTWVAPAARVISGLSMGVPYLVASLTLNLDPFLCSLKMTAKI